MAHIQVGGLLRDLRRWDLVALVVNSVIGAGIFGLPSRVYALTGPYSIAAYLVAALAMALIVFCFAEVGSRFTATGGPYLYARTAFGSFVGFQVGWLMWLARVAAFAALCNLAIGYLTHFAPVLGAGLWRAGLIVAVVGALTAVNVAGVRISAGVTNAFTVGKLIPLLLIAGVGVWFVDLPRLALAGPPDYGSFSQAALLLVFAYTGFEAAVIPAGEARNPGQHVPFALLVGIATVTSVYVLVQVVCVGVLPGLAASERPLADVGQMLFGPPGASLLVAGAVISTTGTMNGIMFATPRLLFAMAEHGEVPRLMSTTHAGYRTPVAAIIVTAAAALLATLLSTFVAALTIASVARLLTYAAAAAALPVLRRRADLPPPPFLAPYGRVTAVAAVALIVWLLSNSTWREATLVSLACLAGLLIYFPSVRRHSAPQLNEVA
jgi:amino acid transporter